MSYTPRPIKKGDEFTVGVQANVYSVHYFRVGETYIGAYAYEAQAANQNKSDFLVCTASGEEFIWNQCVLFKSASA